MKSPGSIFSEVKAMKRNRFL